jgi:hypothetical protein
MVGRNDGKWIPLPTYKILASNNLFLTHQKMMKIQTNKQTNKQTKIWYIVLTDCASAHNLIII